MSIPKVIHYCWFGGNEKPAIIKKCIKSWKKYCPDYRIVEWNESNFDVNCIPFCKQAYEAKKWAFVTDYVRLKVLHEHGGIYMDTDVELIKSLDNFLELSCFLGFQHESYVSNGLVFGTEPGHPFVHENAAVYEQMAFVNESDSLKLVVCQEYTTEILKRYGLIVPGTGKVQFVNGVHIFPPEYFCPYDHRTDQMNKTENTYAIHHFASSWWDSKRRREYEKNRRKQRIHYIAHTPNRVLKSILGDKWYEAIKNTLKK